MKALSGLLILVWFFPLATQAAEKTLPIDSLLPRMSGNWIRRDDSGVKGDYSWVNFDHKKNKNQVLSFVAWKVNTPIEVTSSPMAQASIETFLSTGYAYHSAKRGEPVNDSVISDMIRHRIITIDIGETGLKHEFEAIEYTYFYKKGVQSTATMANGYCIVVGDTAMFVQHTSSQPISSELAFDMAAGLLVKHLQLDGKPHSYAKGKILKSNK